MEKVVFKDGKTYVICTVENQEQRSYEFESFACACDFIRELFNNTAHLTKH